MTKLKVIDKNMGISYSLRYAWIMGDLNCRADTTFNYLLPFKNGKKVNVNIIKNLKEDFFIKPALFGKKNEYQVINQPNDVKGKSFDLTNEKETYYVESQTPDTICSMRKGVVVKITNTVDDKAEQTSLERQKNTIIVEHSDGTLAVYKGFKRNGVFVKLGQTVYPQSELGIMEMTKKGVYEIEFFIYFLRDNEFRSRENVDFNNYKKMYHLITPYFITNEGLLKLGGKKEYTSISNEMSITKEFSRSEKKKYIKDPILFK